MATTSVLPENALAFAKNKNNFDLEKRIESLAAGVRYYNSLLKELNEVNRQNPSYRNSIKESISAVEAICELIVKNKTTLGKALDIIEKRVSVQLPPALKQGFDKLYGFTSSAQGIRHSLGLTEEEDLKEDDARFFLIACSAFVNYLTSKASAAGIEFSQ